MGVKVHGIDSILYVVNADVRKGASQILTILMDVLSNHIARPATVSIQVDGSSGMASHECNLIPSILTFLDYDSENWNKYLLAFGCEVILSGWVAEVQIHRLPVGWSKGMMV